MATVNPGYFNFGQQFEQGQEQARQRNLQDIVFGQQQEDRALRMQDRQANMAAAQQQQQAQQAEGQYVAQVRQAQTLYNAANALKRVPPERRKQALATWGQANPLLAQVITQLPPDADLSDASLDEFAAGMGTFAEQARQPNSDFIRALDIVRNPNATEEEKLAAQISLGMKPRAVTTAPQLVQTVDPATGQVRWESVDVKGGSVPTGTPVPNVKEAAATEAERKAAGFYERMLNSRENLSKLEGEGYKPTTRDILTAGGSYTNVLATPQGQQYRQAQENWIRANLRKESGAVIGAEEMASEIKNYFPQVGDSPQVIAQKEQNRVVLEQNMLREAGRAAEKRPQQAAKRLKYNPATGRLE